jgi:hypothetical protein
VAGKDERAGAGKVLTRLARALGPLGFARTKPTFFTRPRELVIEFVHLHKFRFGPAFRVHLGLRVTNDPFDAAALNGPNSHVYTCPGPPGGRRYDFHYGETPEAIDRCAAELADFVRLVGEPWFGSWRDPQRLAGAADSPLDSEASGALRAALKNGPDPRRVALAARLLGLP